MLPEKAADYKYLPLECPSCGFKGKARISRLDQTFHCKQCDKVFHVTLDGTVRGERPPEEVHREPAAAVVVEKPSWLERTFGRLPPAARWGVLGALALLLAFGASRLLEPAEPLPGELEDRAVLAAKSFALGDWSTLKRLALSRTAGRLGTWYDKNRPAEWSEADPADMRFKVVTITKGLKRYEKATPIMDARVSAEAGPAGKPTYDILFLWDQTEVGEWWLDGERMLKEVKVGKTKPANTKTSVE